MATIQSHLPKASQITPIYTPRLCLRPFRWSDLAGLVKLRSTPEVMQWTSQGRIDDSIDQTKAWMQRFILTDTDERPLDHYNFVVHLRDHTSCADGSSIGTEEGQLIGVCGLVSLNSLPVSSKPIFGYMFLPEAWGKGYGTEAVRGFQEAWWQMLASKPDAIDIGTIRAVTVATNTPSMNILRKCGWVVDDTLPEEEGVVRWVLRRS